ncbi:DMT family transporter [Streptomyces sp. WMMC500]|uniref:DMT family transporter n=1 Tax=Streptomyces sp. WMMC500 TaxID=3015154 RepID=UPI00248B4523|nr:DMT family transporter [Streptomyces sp. WMMC500]WBB59554.1 DMT family transporter [Streptomyces sp. WMMC500]
MWWGVAAALLANVFISSGFVLEKRALSALPELSVKRPGRMVRVLVSSPLWLAGCLSLGLGFAAQVLCYRTLPLAAAQGILVSGLVLLILLSSRFLGERLSPREIAGVGAILLSLGMIVLSLDKDADTVSTSAPAGRFLLIAVPSLAAGLWLYLAAELRAKRRHRIPTTGIAYGVGVGFLYGVSSLTIKGVSGLVSGSDLLGTAGDLLTSPYPYTLLFTGAAGLVMSQAALQRCRASLIVPVCTTANCLHAVAAGTFVFGEPLPDDVPRLLLRLGGIALAVSVLLALPRHDEPAPERAPGEAPGAAPGSAPVRDAEPRPVRAGDPGLPPGSAAGPERGPTAVPPAPVPTPDRGGPVP